MRQETMTRGRHTGYVRHFSDWLEFVSLAERVNREHRDGRFGAQEMICSSLRSENWLNEWSGSRTLGEAIQLARHGWPEGRRRFNEVRDRLQLKHLLPHSHRITTHFDVSGDEPDIDRYLLGDPENMVTLNDVVNPRYGKVVRFVFNITTRSKVTSSTYLRRGVAVFAALESLLVLGFSPEVSIVFSVTSTEDDSSLVRYEQYLPILHAGDPINLDTLIFMFLHPSVLRRLDFATQECESAEIRRSFYFYAGGVYGWPIDPVFLSISEQDLFVGVDEGLLESEDQIVPYALELLRRVGVEVPQTTTV